MSPVERRYLEDLIEAAINLLDQDDGEADQEDDGTAEPWLGWTKTGAIGNGLDLEISHLQIGYDPNVNFRIEMKLSLFGFEELDLGPRSPTLGGLAVEEGDPVAFLVFGESVNGSERQARESENGEQSGIHGTDARARREVMATEV